MVRHNTNRKINIRFKILLAVVITVIIAFTYYMFIKPTGYTINPILRGANIEIGDFIVRYNDNMIREKDYSKYLGDVFLEEENQIWYYHKDKKSLSVLLCKEADGTVTYWNYAGLEVDGDTYSYNDVLKLIYGVESAKDIVSVKTEPAPSNFDYGLKYKLAVGTHTYNDKDELEAIYDIFSSLTCCESSDEMRIGNQDRFNYSFSEKEEQQEISLEEVLASRKITIQLADGTEIAGWTYNALSGCIYKKYYVYTLPLEDADVHKLNEIFGIK